jgi:hypothetical protein
VAYGAAVSRSHDHRGVNKGQPAQGPLGSGIKRAVPRARYQRVQRGPSLGYVVGMTLNQPTQAIESDRRKGKDSGAKHTAMHAFMHEVASYTFSLHSRAEGGVECMHVCIKLRVIVTNTLHSRAEGICEGGVECVHASGHACRHEVASCTNTLHSRAAGAVECMHACMKL